jgi:hypothetical protein
MGPRLRGDDMSEERRHTDVCSGFPLARDGSDRRVAAGFYLYLTYSHLVWYSPRRR